MRDLKIRQLKLEDLHSLYHCGLSIYENSHHNLLQWNEENLSSIFFEDMSYSFVAMKKNKIIAFIIALADRHVEEASIQWFGLLKNYYRYKVQHSLLDHFIKHCSKHNICKISYSLTDAPEILIETFEKNNFTQSSESKIYNFTYRNNKLMS